MRSVTQSPPIAAMRLRFWRGVVDGMKIVPWMRFLLQAKATPCAWLPADAHTTPLGVSSGVSEARKLYAPRTL